MPERRGFELNLDFRFPVLQLTLLALALWAFLVGGTVTFGTWGDTDVRLLATYLIGAAALHAFSAYPTPRLWPRIVAWGLVVAMLVHTQVLLQPVVLVTVALLAALDTGLHATRVPKRESLPLGARIALVATGLVTLGLLWFLWSFATFEALTRVGAAVILAAALAVACTLYPALRAPMRLLPALGVYYLFFVLMAAPVLPFGPALAWWMLCGAVLVGAVVSARHVSGPELPPTQRKHEHVVSHLPDPFVAHDAEAIERYLATGAGAKDLSLRLERATGRDAGGTALGEYVKSIAGGRGQRQHREYALRRLMETTE